MTREKMTTGFSFTFEKKYPVTDLILIIFPWKKQEIIVLNISIIRSFTFWKSSILIWQQP